MGEQQTGTFYTSGSLARSAGVSSDTIRHYERLGLLAKPARTSGGYRQYPPAALDRVLLVRRALAVGFSLKELARILRVREGGGAPCREVRALAASKLDQVKRRMEELATVRDQLGALIQDWDRKLARTPEGQRAGLLESLAESSRGRQP